MRGHTAVPLLLALLTGCQATGGSLRAAGPLENEGEVYLYLQPFPKGTDGLSFSVQDVSAIQTDGSTMALDLVLPDLSGRQITGQRMLAWGRLPPGSYAGFALAVKRATLETDGAAVDLAVPSEPARIDVPFTVARRKAVVLLLSFQHARSVEKASAFSPTFFAAAPEATLAQAMGYCSNTGADNLTVFDKRERQVVGVLPTGRRPMGVALDPRLNRAYVALAGDDQIQIVDMQSGEEVGRIPLRSGDRPREVGLTPDSRLLVVINPGSNTASFVDPAASVEIDRVDLRARLGPSQAVSSMAGDEPVSLLMDRAGRRAYVFNRRSSSIAVLDLANHAVAGAVRTDAEPLRGQLSRDGTRLYVIHGGSAYLNVFSLPDLALKTRIFVGLGASALQVDPRTDLVYVGKRDEDQLSIFDPLSFVPVSRLDVPDSVTSTVIADAENVLFALVPSRRSVVGIDLVGGKTLAQMEVGNEPYQVTVNGERR